MEVENIQHIEEGPALACPLGVGVSFLPVLREGCHRAELMEENTSYCGPSAPLSPSASSWTLRASCRSSSTSYARPRRSRLENSKNAFWVLRACSIPLRLSSSTSSYSPIS